MHRFLRGDCQLNMSAACTQSDHGPQRTRPVDPWRAGSPALASCSLRWSAQELELNSKRVVYPSSLQSAQAFFNSPGPESQLLPSITCTHHKGALELEPQISMCACVGGFGGQRRTYTYIYIYIYIYIDTYIHRRTDRKSVVSLVWGSLRLAPIMNSL